MSMSSDAMHVYFITGMTHCARERPIHTAIPTALRPIFFPLDKLLLLSNYPSMSYHYLPTRHEAIRAETLGALQGQVMYAAHESIKQILQDIKSP